jgi:hypothetical protein
VNEFTVVGSEVQVPTPPELIALTNWFVQDVVVIFNPALVKAPVIPAVTFEPDGFEKLMPMPSVVAPFSKLTGEARLLPLLTVRLMPPPPL